MFRLPNGFNLIAGMTKATRGIGFQGKLPWPHSKKDMINFSKITKGDGNNSVIMGRNTWESLPSSYRPLPDRTNIIVSETMCDDDIGWGPFVKERYNRTQQTEDGQTYYIENNLPNALSMANPEGDAFIIGGQRMYEQGINMPECNKIFMTEFLKDYPADTFFPQIPGNFKMVEKVEDGDLVFKTYENKGDYDSEEYQYLNTLKRILKDGDDIKDRTGVGTRSVFDANMNFNIKTLNPDEPNITKLKYQIPILTTKNLYFKGVIWELLWFLSGNTDAKWLQERDVHIWDGHTSEEYLRSRGLQYQEGQLGPGYGHQWVNWGGNWRESSQEGGINQIRRIINLLKEDPASRRAVLSAWNVEDLDLMALPPCHMMYLFNVTNHSAPRPNLNCKVILRSNDMFLGSPFNIASTAVLTVLMSRALNMLPGQVAVSINDAHIYQNHIEQVKEQLERIPLTFPTLEIPADINNYEDMIKLTYDDFKLTDYYKWASIKASMAI